MLLLQLWSMTDSFVRKHDADSVTEVPAPRSLVTSLELTLLAYQKPSIIATCCALCLVIP